MIFLETKLSSAYVLEIEKKEDSRGFFARTWCKNELEAHGLCSSLLQANVGFSRTKGTLRGMHFQTDPCAEIKLVRCTMGTVYDVIVDLRVNSPTFKQWISVELSADNHRMLYVPEGFAHGYQTLTENTELFYLTSQLYSPKYASGVRYDDPAFKIHWPLEVTLISEADQKWPKLN